MNASPLRRILSFAGARSVAGLLVAAAALGWLHWFGYVYGTSNTLEQVTFIKRHLDPTYLEGDFAVGSSGAGGARYFYILGLATLSRCTTIETAHFILYLVCLGAFIVVTYLLARQLFPSRLAAGCTTFLATYCLGYTLDANQLWREFMYPSSVAVPLAVLGLVLALRGRQVAALLVMGVTTLLHLLVGVEMAALTLLAQIYTRRKEPFRPLVTAAVAYLIVALPTLIPMALGQLQPSSARLTSDELLLALGTFRAPWHYRPFLWEAKDYYHFFALLLIGWTCRHLLQPRRGAPAQGALAAVAVLGSTALLFWTAVGAGQAGPSPTAQVFTARLLAFAGFLLLAATGLPSASSADSAATWPLLPEEAQPTSVASRNLLDAWMVGILLLCVVGVVFVELVPVGLVIKAQLFRLTIFLKLFLLVYIGRGMAALLLSPHPLENVVAPLLGYALLAGQVEAALVLTVTAVAFRRIRLSLAGRRAAVVAVACWSMIASCAWFLAHAPHQERFVFLAAFLAVAAVLIRAVALVPGARRPAAVAVGAGLAVAALVGGTALRPGVVRSLAAELRAQASAHAQVDGGLGQLASFCRRHSRATDVFLIPPQLEQFRDVAERPVVVDFKLVPFDMPGLKEWWERINAVTGQAPRRQVRVRDFRTVGFMDRIRLVESGYSRLRPEEVVQIRQRYGARFMVATPAQRMPFAEVFRSPGFVVYEIP
jgi:hypothetical protein